MIFRILKRHLVIIQTLVLTTFADRIEKARSKAGFPKTLRMSSGGGFRQQGPGLVIEL